MEFTNLKGRYRRSTWRVTNDLTVPESTQHARWLNGFGLPVLSSGNVIALVEDTCWSAMVPLVGSEDGLVGRRFEMAHRGPAAVGDYVEIEVDCIAVDGRTVTWSGLVTNLRTTYVVAEVEHDVTVVRRESFLHKLSTAGSS